MITYNGPVRTNAAGVELYAHGSVSFPCGCYYNDPLESEVPWHWHDEYEFVTVEQGKLAYLAGGERYVLRAGDAAFVNAGVPHAEEAVNGTHALEGDLVCHPRMLYGDKTTALWVGYFSRLAQPDAVQTCALRADGEPWEREAAELVRRAHAAIAEEEEFFELTAREALARVCLLVLANTGPSRSVAVGTYERGVRRVKAMVTFIEGHYAEEVTTGQIADAGGVSEREAQREFRQLMGQSPLEYLNNHRLFVASQRLKSGAESVSAIARACGFPNHSYFSRRFRERYGHAPSEHREH